jgi:hypothetical protein
VLPWRGAAPSRFRGGAVSGVKDVRNNTRAAQGVQQAQVRQGQGRQGQQGQPQTKTART